METGRQVIVCNWHECPFVEDVTTRFADAYGLTAREHDILTRVVDGLDVVGIANELVISQGTVKAHLHRIYRKVGASGRTDLMRAYRAFGRSEG